MNDFTFLSIAYQNTMTNELFKALLLNPGLVLNFFGGYCSNGGASLLSIYISSKCSILFQFLWSKWLGTIIEVQSYEESVKGTDQGVLYRGSCQRMSLCMLPVMHRSPIEGMYQKPPTKQITTYFICFLRIPSSVAKIARFLLVLCSIKACW